MPTVYHAVVAASCQLESMKETDFVAHYLGFVSRTEGLLCRLEETMERDDPVCLREAREQHALLLSALHALIPSVLRADTVLARDLLHCLPVWFSHLAVHTARTVPSAAHPLPIRPRPSRLSALNGARRPFSALPMRAEPLTLDTPTANRLPC